MRSRAAILPFPGDPYLLNYWLHLFDTHWHNEVDVLYIGFNSPIESAMVRYIRDLCEARPNIKLFYWSEQMEHGAVIDAVLDMVREEYVMLIEDDGFIFKPHIVNECFKYIESGQYDIVGSKRGSCAMEILKRAQELWGLSYEGEGDQGPNFWPSFFFTKREILLRTDRNFGAKAWKRGEVIEALGNYVVQDEVANGDTMVHMSLQLRAMIPQDRIFCVPQYHGHPDDMEHYVTHRAHTLFEGNAPWCHIGSLSSGVGGILKDEHNRALARRLVDPEGGATVLPKEWCQSDFEKREFERRVQWWLTFWEASTPTVGTEEFYELYGKAVHRIIEQFGLNMRAIQQRQLAYKSLGL